jgi:hypothetical protein
MSGLCGQLSEQHELDAYLYFIRQFIVYSQAWLSSAATPSPFDTSPPLLVQETQRLARDHSLQTAFDMALTKAKEMYSVTLISCDSLIG